VSERASEILTVEQVRRIWWEAGGGHNRLLLEWLSPVVAVWRRQSILASQVGVLRFVGSERGSPRDVLTTGTYRVRDAKPDDDPVPEFSWDPGWSLIVAQDPESLERVILDGNERALALWRAVRTHSLPPETNVDLVVGELHPWVIRLGKPLSPLWR
jgi:hypothetical protein